MTAEEIIEQLCLERHPEGGWFRRTYESLERLGLDRGVRSAGTTIYYLLADGERSALHQLSSDETWYYHAGCGMNLHLFGENDYQCKRLGSSFSHGEQPQIAIPAGVTLGAELSQTSNWCLVSCSVCPGFDFDDFEWAAVPDLLERFPEEKELIERLKR